MEYYKCFACGRKSDTIPRAPCDCSNCRSFRFIRERVSTVRLINQRTNRSIMLWGQRNAMGFQNARTLGDEDAANFGKHQLTVTIEDDMVFIEQGNMPKTTTMLNDSVLIKKVELKDGSVLKIGELELIVSITKMNEEIETILI